MGMTFAFVLYVILVVEVITLFLLALPLRFISKPIARTLRLSQKPMLFLLLALTVVVAGFYLDMQKYQMRYESSSSELERNKVLPSKFKSERDVYLGVFSLTLLAALLRFGPLVADYNDLRAQQPPRPGPPALGKPGAPQPPAAALAAAGGSKLD